jgi:hypothetical protein
MRFMFVVLLGILFIGCDGEARDVDSTPENQSGVPSGEFEQDDIDAAEGASALVGIYCEGAESEVQEVGCLAHVTDSEICELDTDGKRSAVDTYIEESGEDPC